MVRASTAHFNIVLCHHELSPQPVQLTAGQDAFRKYALNCARNVSLHPIAITASRFDESRVESLRDASNAGLKRQSLTLSKVQAPEERRLLLAVPSQVQAPQAGKEYVSNEVFKLRRHLTIRSRLLCPQEVDHPGQEQVQCAQVPSRRPFHQQGHHLPNRPL
jgi:hypothetical protein